MMTFDAAWTLRYHHIMAFSWLYFAILEGKSIQFWCPLFFFVDLDERILKQQQEEEERKRQRRERKKEKKVSTNKIFS